MTEINIQADTDYPGAWRVESIGGDGEVDIAIFSGPSAQRLAEEYRDFLSARNL